jgi:hypothetical protein
MIGFSMNQNVSAHVSQRCSTQINPFPATTCPTGAIASLCQVGHRRSRVFGNSGSGSGSVAMGRGIVARGGASGLGGPLGTTMCYVDDAEGHPAHDRSAEFSGPRDALARLADPAAVVSAA